VAAEPVDEPPVEQPTEAFDVAEMLATEDLDLEPPPEFGEQQQ
jgi:hypothetical protein